MFSNEISIAEKVLKARINMDDVADAIGEGFGANSMKGISTEKRMEIAARFTQEDFEVNGFDFHFLVLNGVGYFAWSEKNPNIQRKDTASFPAMYEKIKSMIGQ